MVQGKAGDPRLRFAISAGAVFTAGPGRGDYGLLWTFSVPLCLCGENTHSCLGWANLSRDGLAKLNLTRRNAVQNDPATTEHRPGRAQLCARYTSRFNNRLTTGKY